MHIGEIIDRLMYASYKHNRKKGVTVAQARTLWPNQVDRWEAAYQEESAQEATHNVA